MQKRRTTFSEFNPEKFLADDTKKKGQPTGKKRKAYRRLLVLDGGFKTELLDQFDQEHPGIVKVGETPEEMIESARVIRKFFERRLRQEGQGLGPKISHLLCTEFVGALFKRYLDTKKSDLEKEG